MNAFKMHVSNLERLSFKLPSQALSESGPLQGLCT